MEFFFLFLTFMIYNKGENLVFNVFLMLPLFSIANLANNSASELNSYLGNRNPEPHKSVEKCCSTLIKLNKHTVFLLISAQDANVISKLYGALIIRVRRLNEGGV